MITQKQISEWRNNGYVIIDNLFEKDLLKKAVNFMNQKNNLYNLPSPNFGSKNGELEFPTGTILDKLTLHHSIINVVSNLLNTNDVLLTQSDAWSKAKKKTILKITKIIAIKDFIWTMEIILFYIQVNGKTQK